MKRLLLIFACVMSSLSVVANHDKHRIERLVEPYEQAINFIMNVDNTCQVKDHDIFMFFNTTNLYEKKDVRKFNRVVHMVKKLTYTKKSLLESRNELELLIDNLEKVQKFIVDYAATHYALITYYEIAASYYYIDEHHADVTNLIMQQSEKFGLPSMQGRGLYKFVKKIDLNLRRLTALFAQNIISDEVAVKANQIKTKLITLKSKIVENSQYKVQRSKTRWLKAFGIIVVCSTAITIPTLFCEQISLFGAFLIGYVGGGIAGEIAIA